MQINDPTIAISRLNHDTSQLSLPSLSIIIPAYNEENRIVRGLKRTLSFCESTGWDYEIIVASEGSNDRTVELVQSNFLPNNKIKLLTGEKRIGKGGSIKNAIKMTSKDVIAYMDVDLSADPSELSRLLIHAHDCDIVIGSRILREGLGPIAKPLSRAMLSYMYSFIFRLLFVTNIRDPQCGFKILRRRFAQELFMGIATDGFAFDTELLARALKVGARIKEIPIIWKHKEHSKVNPVEQIFAMGKDLVAIRYHILFDVNDKQNIVSVEK